MNELFSLLLFFFFMFHDSTAIIDSTILSYVIFNNSFDFHQQCHFLVGASNSSFLFQSCAILSRCVTLGFHVFCPSMRPPLVRAVAITSFLFYSSLFFRHMTVISRAPLSTRSSSVRSMCPSFVQIILAVSEISILAFLGHLTFTSELIIIIFQFMCHNS